MYYFYILLSKLTIEGQKALVAHMQIESFAILVLRSSPYFIDTCQYIGAHLGRSVEVVHALWTTIKQKRQKSSICSAVQNGASNILRTQPTCTYMHRKKFYMTEVM